LAHYYKLNGDTCYEVVGKNGKTRGTTIADARKLKLVPSVTTVMDVQSKPALIFWLQNQLIEACIDTPFYHGLWDKEEYKKYLITQSKKVREAAAQRGNEVHDLMENYFKDGYGNHEETNVATKLIRETFINYEWIPEASFAHTDGFGGRVDLYGHDGKGNYVIIDYKTKDKDEIGKIVQYDDHKIQLAAYQVGLKLPETTRRFNLFISVHKDTLGECKLIECNQFDKFINLFYALLEVWKIKNNYDPKELFNDRKSAPRL
jgi:hypothetical protein